MQRTLLLKTSLLQVFSLTVVWRHLRKRSTKSVQGYVCGRRKLGKMVFGRNLSESRACAELTSFLEHGTLCLM
ncbi:hypothetical protein EV401DRAFT_1989494, partial [Pisolithus croceorrhizus]